MRDFEPPVVCTICGGTKLDMPAASDRELPDDAMLRCTSCGMEVDSWGTLKGRVWARRHIGQQGSGAGRR